MGRSARKVEDSGAGSPSSYRAPPPSAWHRGGASFSANCIRRSQTMHDIQAALGTAPAGRPPPMHPMDPSRGQRPLSQCSRPCCAGQSVSSR